MKPILKVETEEKADPLPLAAGNGGALALKSQVECEANTLEPNPTDRRTRRAEQVRESEWEMHEQCLQTAQRALSQFRLRNDAKRSLAEIGRLLELASKLGRLAAGMATDKTEQTGHVAGSVSIEFKAALEKIYGEPIEGEVVDAEVVRAQPQIADQGKGPA